MAAPIPGFDPRGHLHRALVSVERAVAEGVAAEALTRGVPVTTVLRERVGRPVAAPAGAGTDSPTGAYPHDWSYDGKRWRCVLCNHTAPRGVVRPDNVGGDCTSRLRHAITRARTDGFSAGIEAAAALCDADATRYHGARPDAPGHVYARAIRALPTPTER